MSTCSSGRGRPPATRSLPVAAGVSAVAEGSTVGPFRLAATDAATIRVSDGQVVDADGVAISEPLEPGAEFYLQVSPGAEQATLTIEVPGRADGFGGRVITGVARDEVAGGFTPLALAVPAQWVCRVRCRVAGGRRYRGGMGDELTAGPQAPPPTNWPPPKHAERAAAGRAHDRHR